MDTDKMMKEAVEVIKKHINGVIDYAINMYGSTPHTKSQVISIVLGQFIAEHLSMLGADDMLKNGRVTSGTDRIDMNVLLNDLGNAGTRIGALAYVLAMRLEAILPEDNFGVQDVADWSTWLRRRRTSNCPIAINTTLSRINLLLICS